MLIFWIAFNLFVVIALVLDLVVLHRRARAIHFKEAMLTTAVWVVLAVGFAAVIFFWKGRQPALEFVAAYVVEEALSVDNLFVFILIFAYFKVAAEYQYQVLFWGILGALVMRGIFIGAGVTLIKNFQWLIYGFGAFLIYTGVMLLTRKNEDQDPQKSLVMRLLRKYVPIAEDYEGKKFFIRREERGQTRLLATPLLLVLVMVETTDLLFATDSVPAVLAISRDAFIVYTSNVFAVLGLRSLYFALAGMMNLFHYLHYGVSAVLVFIGIKMLSSNFYPIGTAVSLGVIASIFGLAVVASLVHPKPAAASDEIPGG